MASGINGTLYVGVTNDVVRRVTEHKSGEVEGFTKKYGVKILVHIEATNNVVVAIEREKQIKGWKRQWKIDLIQEENPSWRGLYPDIASM